MTDRSSLVAIGRRPNTLVRDDHNGSLWTYEKLSPSEALARTNCLTHSFLQRVERAGLFGWRRLNEFKELRASYDLVGHTVIAGGTYKVKYNG